MKRSPKVLATGVVSALVLATLSFVMTSADATTDDAMYRPVAGFELRGAELRVEPGAYAAVSVDTGLVRAALTGAPRAGAASSTSFRVPTPTGDTERFAVQRTQVMQAGLAAAHPEISTWAGRSLDHPGSTIALDLTPMGFHASVRGPGGQGAWYVDPAYDRPGTTTHLSYYGASVPRPEEEFVERQAPPGLDRAVTLRQARVAAGAPVEQRVYRLALLSDPSYARHFGSANVTAEKVTLINRVNQVYNDDLAINLQLVDGTDDLNLDTSAEATGANGPCGAHPCFDEGDDDFPGDLDVCWPGTLTRNAAVLGELIGAANYDIGHIVLGSDGGGIAGIGVVGTSAKAQGCTGVTRPEGDFFAIDFVAHEMGHQFGGHHTFNGFDGNCGDGNRTRSTSVEPGSGSSVMAYAGICGSDNLQPHSDPYFSQRTLTEVTAFAGTPVHPVVEMQTVSLRGFDANGETIEIGYPGATSRVTLTRGVNYDAAGVEAAVEQVTGTDVTIGAWGYAFDDIPGPSDDPDDTGFTVTFAGDPDPDTSDSDFEDMRSLTVESSSAGVSGSVSETAQGGPAGNQGDEIDLTDNHAPVVTAPPARTLPMRTPFTLSGSATDEDGDPLTYLWEQNDTGGTRGTALSDNTRQDGPLFRIFGTYANVTAAGSLQSPSPGRNTARASGLRTFPDLAQILDGNTNAKTGRCEVKVPGGSSPLSRRAVDCFSEFLPVKGYVGTAGSTGPAMHFRLTARDSEPGGGGVGYHDVTLRLDPEAGPFLVRSFERGGKVKGGKKHTITWKVNGTKKLASRVRIVLSTDNGKTWKKVLAGKTANDGRATVRFPRVEARRAWIMIQAVDNYFFDVNGTAFRIW
jgi:hypothetical protein